jgi:hypothetical protein
VSGDLYQAPQIKISQGDIIDISPHVYLDQPLFGVTLRAGSVVNSGTFSLDGSDKKGKSIVATASRRRAILMTHDCTIDKPNEARWHICPIVSLFELSSKLQDSVKRNRDYSKLFLPKFGSLGEDSFVNFNQISTIHRDIIGSAKRILSLSDIGRHALYVQYIRWLTRWELRTITCPLCNAVIDPTAVLPVRSA